MNRRGFLKAAAVPIAGAAVVGTVVAKNATAKQDAPSFKVVLLDGNRPISKYVDCRFRIAGNYATSLDKLSFDCAEAGKQCKATHIGLGEFRVPIDEPYEFSGHGGAFEVVEFWPGDINFSFAVEPDPAA